MTTENNSPFANTESSTNTASAIPTELTEWVGEGKKYRTVEDAMKSVPHAQSHIQKLEAERVALQEELAKRKAAEEVLAEIKAASTKTVETPAKSVDEATIAAIAARTLEQREQTRIYESNAQSVAGTLKEKFGDKAEDVYKAKAAELGLSIEDFNAMSRKSPKAVLAFFPQGSTKDGKLHSSVNTAAMPTKPTEQPRKSIFMGTSEDLLSAWRAAKPSN
jgi:hypothetical protein